MGETTLLLSYGRHYGGDQRVCLLEAASLLGGEPKTDQPSCVCPVLAAFGRILNDEMGDDDVGDALRARHIAPLVARLVGTRSTPAVERRRACLLVDAGVRKWAPLALRTVGRDVDADELERLAPVDDSASASEASAVVLPLRDQLFAAGDPALGRVLSTVVQGLRILTAASAQPSLDAAPQANAGDLDAVMAATAVMFEGRAETWCDGRAQAWMAPDSMWAAAADALRRAAEVTTEGGDDDLDAG